MVGVGVIPPDLQILKLTPTLHGVGVGVGVAVGVATGVAVGVTVGVGVILQSKYAVKSKSSQFIGVGVGVGQIPVVNKFAEISGHIE